MGKRLNLCLAKVAAVVIIVLLIPTAYAASELAVTAPDLTWPLIFNGVAPLAGIIFFAKRFLKGLDETLKELIETKNDHHARIGNIETIHKVKGCDQPHNEATPHRRRGEK